MTRAERATGPRRLLEAHVLAGSALALALAIAACSCSTPAPDRPGACRLTPIHTGICALGADHVLGDPHGPDERMPFVILAFLVESPAGERALVDLGPLTLDYTNAMFRRYGFFRDLGEAAPGERYPDDVRQPHGNVLRGLADLGTGPADIGHIVFTHLHADHHGMDDAKGGGAATLFPLATLHVSRIGWDDNLRRRTAGGWASYVDHAFGDFLLDREKAGQVRFADDEEIFPGLRTLHLGGHSVCSQAVLVETADGIAVITSDEVYQYALLEEAILPRLHVSPERYRDAVEKLVRLVEETGGILVPIHDPVIWETWERSGERWLATLRPISDRAIRGYRLAGGIRLKPAE